MQACRVCGEELEHTKWNSDVGMLKCVNMKCSLYCRPVSLTETGIVKTKVRIPKWLAEDTTISVSTRATHLRDRLGSGNGTTKKGKKK